MWDYRFWMKKPITFFAYKEHLLNEFRHLVDEGGMVCGLNRARKLIIKGCVTRAYIATDASISLQYELGALCAAHSVETVRSYSMQSLGDACGLDVGCAVAVMISQN